MRDIALLVFFIACVPAMIKRPALGVVMWIWLSVMNPHRLTYTFAYELNFAAAAAIITFFGLLVSKDERRLAVTPPVLMLAIFAVWMCLSALVSFHPASGYDMWLRVMKIMLMTFVAFTVIHSKKQIHWVVWVVVFSLGFYGLKGGLFTLLSGGSYRVWGPAGSFIEGNNEVALALVMIIPLMRYVQIGLKNKWHRRGMTVVMLFSALASIGSQSRGALVAMAAMGAFLVLKSRNKIGMGFVAAIVAVALLAFMPAEWMERMNTIRSYDEDASAMGRINAWWMTFNLAKDHLFGGGFDIYDAEIFARYAPNPLDIHAAHSIYFQVMGEHGFVGLFLFVSIGVLTWLAASTAKQGARSTPDLHWVGPLMDMCKVSMIGYGVGGAFLSLAYFDVPYYVIVIVVATRAYVLKAATAPSRARGANPRRQADRFGVVPVVAGDVAPEAPLPPAPKPRVDDWRGQGNYSHPRPAFVLGTKATDR